VLDFIIILEKSTGIESSTYITASFGRKTKQQKKNHVEYCKNSQTSTGK
jgi:hypothetical protein